MFSGLAAPGLAMVFTIISPVVLKGVTFDRYRAVFKSNGKVVMECEYDPPLGQTRRLATERLDEILRRSHGRGDHTVTIYGLVWKAADWTAPMGSWELGPQVFHL